ncbi:MAG: hypothetical protein JRJ29_08750 [Deltaproteobacteria bacterium]|nr:hypothetical protein [Deltaproteobacteria bacterium]
MTPVECISNRNFKIIASYLEDKLGHWNDLFQGCPYPSVHYESPEDFFLNEDEWTSLDNFQRIFRKAREMVGEPYFYFNCGASSARLRSWGRLNYFVKVFLGPSDGFKRLPFFNKNFNKTKEFDTVIPPYYEQSIGKIRTIIKVQYHEDIDVNKDYITDPYRRGLISSIPSIWGLRPAIIRQPLNPYDPERLFNEEPEFTYAMLQAKMERGYLTIRHPRNGKRKIIGKEILLEPEYINGERLFLGKYRDVVDTGSRRDGDHEKAVIISETVTVQDRIMFKAGEIFGAPYFILDITYDRGSFLSRLKRLTNKRATWEGPGAGLTETINRLRETIDSRNEAYRDLERTNRELLEAKKRVEHYSSSLEQEVMERTSALRKAQEELRNLNRHLEEKVRRQVSELERYNELRRYLAPKLAERILSSGDKLGDEPQRKMMTVLFADIRNFSQLTDALEPEEIFPLLNGFLSEMIRLTHRFEGTLNKIIGDGLLIFFGDPVPMVDHAQRAVRMAIEMQKKVHEMGPQWLQYGHVLGIGIGINTGYMTVGNIGSDIHKDYTVIGKQVNVAARLESLAKAGQILIGQRTYSRVKGIVDAEMVGQLKVKGIHHPITTYNVKAF